MIASERVASARFTSRHNSSEVSPIAGWTRTRSALGDPSASNKIFDAEAGEVLGVSHTTVESDWAMARA